MGERLGRLTGEVAVDGSRWLERRFFKKGIPYDNRTNYDGGEKRPALARALKGGNQIKGGNQMKPAVGIRTARRVALCVIALLSTSMVAEATPLDAEIRFSSATFSAGESALSATITLVRGGPVNGVAIVNYATSAGTATPGSDYQDVSGTVVFLPAQTAAAFEVPLMNDTADEADETVALSLSITGLGTLVAPSTAMLGIADDDLSGSTLGVLDAFSAREDEGHSVFTVSLWPAATQPVSVFYKVVGGTATVGSDIIDTNGTLTFAPGVTKQKVAVALVDDNVAEATESYTLSLINPSNATITDPTGVAAITDYTTVLQQISPTLTTYVRDVDGGATEFSGDYSVGVTPSGDVTGPLSITPVIPNDGCTALPAGSMTGKVALIRRGTCTFQAKALNAQNAGAIAVLIYNSSDGIVVLGGITSPVTVPVMGLTKALGESLVSQLTLGPVSMKVTIPA